MKPFFLTSELTLNLLLPLIQRLSSDTDTLLSRNLIEVCGALTSPPSSLVVVDADDIHPVGYICGYFLTPSDFFLSQAIHISGKPNGKKVFALIEKAAREMGAKRIILHTPHHPRIFRQYGLQFSRFILLKELTNDSTKRSTSKKKLSG